MPLLRLTNALRGPIPPNGYRWVDPADGFEVITYDYREWVEKASRHMTVNNRPVPDDLSCQMEHQLCQTLEPGWCMYDDPSRPRVSTSLTWDDVKSALSVFKKWLADGMPVVTQAEADRRAKVCTSCYMNANIGGCSACQKLVAEVTGKLKTRYDAYLRACAVCKCVLKAKVHFPQSALDKENSKLQEMYPEHCWLKHGGPNHVN